MSIGSYRRLAAAIAALAFLAGHASAQQASPLKGAMFLSGKTVVDPPAGEARNSHAYLTIEGPAAERMYRAMTAPARDDLCLGEGAKIKRQGSFSCSITRAGAASCDFSVDLVRGTLAGGKPC